MPARSAHLIGRVTRCPRATVVGAAEMFFQLVHFDSVRASVFSVLDLYRIHRQEFLQRYIWYRLPPHCLESVTVELMANRRCALGFHLLVYRVWTLELGTQHINLSEKSRRCPGVQNMHFVAAHVVDLNCGGAFSPIPGPDTRERGEPSINSRKTSFSFRLKLHVTPFWRPSKTSCLFFAGQEIRSGAS